MSDIIGLDIGSYAVKLVGLRKTSQGPFLTHLRMKEIPRGRQEDGPFIAELIKALFREVDLKPGRVTLVVPGFGANIRRLTVPALPKAELQEAVRWEIKDHLSFPPESAQIDFQVLGEFVEENAKKLDLVAVACPRHIIAQTLVLAAGAGLKPMHLDVGPLALWNVLLARGQRPKEETVALIDLGAEKTSISLIKNGVLQFNRETAPAGMDITRAVMEGIDTGEDADSLYARAEKIKQEVGIPVEADREKGAGERPSLAKLSFLVRPVLERLAAEIQRSLDYCRSQFSVERVDRLLLTGGTSKLKNLDSYLTRELRLPVELFNPLSEINFDSRKIDAPFIGQMGPLFSVALGVALPNPKRAELLPVQESFWTWPRLEKLISPVALLITLLIFLWFYGDMNKQVALLSKKRDVKAAKVRTLDTLQEKLALLKGKEHKMKQDLSLFPSALVPVVSFPEILRSIGQLVPDNVTVTMLSVQSKAKPAKGEVHSPGEKELLIRGLAFGSDQHCLAALAQLIERLEKSSLFRNAQLVLAHENKLYNQPATEFEIACDIYENGQKRKGNP